MWFRFVQEICHIWPIYKMHLNIDSKYEYKQFFFTLARAEFVFQKLRQEGS